MGDAWGIGAVQGDASAPAAAPTHAAFVPCDASNRSARLRSRERTAAFWNIFTAESPITSAAVVIMNQSGECVASSTPTGALHAPPHPIRTPSDTQEVLWRACVTTPETDVGITVNRAVAVHSIAGIPPATRSSVTKRPPPPMPSKPEAMPTKKPNNIFKYHISAVYLHNYSLSGKLKRISPVAPGSI